MRPEDTVRLQHLAEAAISSRGRALAAVLAAASVSTAMTILLVHALRHHLLGALHPLVLTVSHKACQGLRIRDLNFNPSHGLRPQAMS